MRKLRKLSMDGRLHKRDRTFEEVELERKGFVPAKARRGLLRIQGLVNDVILKVDPHGEGIYICGGYARYCMSPTRNPSLSDDVDLYTSCSDIFFKLQDRLKHICYNVKDTRCSLYCRPPDAWSECPPINLIYPLSTNREGPMNEAELQCLRENDGPSFFNEDVAEDEPGGGPPPARHCQKEEDTYDILDILNTFDFTIARAGLYYPYIRGYVDQDFFDDEKHKRLRCRNVQSPIGYVYRANKYGRKGYNTIDYLSLQKVINRWEALSFDEKNRKRNIEYDRNK